MKFTHRTLFITHWASYIYTIFIYMTFWNLCLCGCIIKKWNNLEMFIMKKKGKLEKSGGDSMEDAFIHRFSSWSALLYLLNQNLSFANIYVKGSSRSVLLSCSFAIMRVRQRKSDSSFCRGPLMISLKWLTALNSIGKLPQSKQIWSVLETESGGSLGKGRGVCVCGGQHEKVHVCKTGWGSEGLLMRSTSGWRVGGRRHNGSWKNTTPDRCPLKHPFLHVHTPSFLTSILYPQSHLCNFHFHSLNEHNKYISSPLMDAIWQP